MTSILEDNLCIKIALFEIEKKKLFKIQTSLSKILVLQLFLKFIFKHVPIVC